MSIIDRAETFDDREARLRWAMLVLVHTRGDGYIGCSVLADKARDSHGQPCDTDDMATRLIDDLLSWGFVQEEPSPYADGVPRTIRHRRVKLTRLGFQLRMAMIPPHPGVWDSRNDPES